MVVGVAALAIAFMFAIFAGTAKADNVSNTVQINSDTTLVVNHGNNPGDTCSMLLIQVTPYSISYSYYSGFLVLIGNANMLKLQCHTKLYSGPGVDKNLQFDFGNETQLFNPGGVANLNLRY